MIRSLRRVGELGSPNALRIIAQVYLWVQAIAALLYSVIQNPVIKQLLR